MVHITGSQMNIKEQKHFKHYVSQGRCWSVHAFNAEDEQTLKLKHSINSIDYIQSSSYKSNR